MAQNRDKIKDDTIELSVPTDTPCPLSCPICPGPDPARSCGPETASRPRSEGRKRPAEDPEGPGREGGVGSGQARVERKTRTVNRCSGCKKRVGLTGFRCRCGDLFCSEHRYSDRHECSYDYKAAGREAIERENPVVRAAKLLRV